MNKQVSVQYAYKKDGKGERHGDQAERMLAAQARKHNVRPPTQSIPPQFPAPTTPTVPGAMFTGDASRPISTGPPDQGLGRGPMPPPQPVGFTSNMAPPQPPMARPGPPAASLATPPPGLPARPPPSQAGYGGPQAFLPPGFGSAGQQASFPPQAAAPTGFGPPGFGPPTGNPGAPPPLPPGFQQLGHGHGH